MMDMFNFLSDAVNDDDCSIEELEKSLNSKSMIKNWFDDFFDYDDNWEDWVKNEIKFFLRHKKMSKRK
jgi:hypothetical protein